MNEFLDVYDLPIVKPKRLKEDLFLSHLYVCVHVHICTCVCVCAQGGQNTTSDARTVVTGGYGLFTMGSGN